MKKWNPNVAHVVYATDDRFAEILGVSLLSLYENSKDMDSIIVYILDSGISEVNKMRIETVCTKYDRPTPIWIEGVNISEILSMKVAVDRGSLSQYARLFISRNIPKDVGRVLYLDCDTVIRKSIRELWNLELNGKTIAALKDAFSKYYRANIELQPNDIMFNSGVMLIDLNKWEEQDVEKKLLKFIAKHKGLIQQGDQGALNAVLAHDTFCFEPKFNSVTIYYDFDYKNMLIYRKPPRDFYSDLQIQDASDDPSLVHFTTSFLSKRPWIKGCQHRFVREWLMYKDLSPWRDMELWDDTLPQWKQSVREIYNALPVWLSVRIVGIAQAYGRPFLNKIKDMCRNRKEDSAVMSFKNIRINI